MSSGIHHREAARHAGDDSETDGRHDDDLSQQQPARIDDLDVSPGSSSHDHDDVEHARVQDEDLEVSGCADLFPRPSKGEKMRDRMFHTLYESCFFRTMDSVVLFLIVGVGAWFFFFLMGWQTLCRPRTDCPQRNTGYNLAVQALNVLFTYVVLIACPWRCAHMLHTLGWSCPHRSNDIGHDLYGLPSKDVWFHVQARRRIGILACLLLNVLCQLINQGTRIHFYSYELQDTWPGNLWTNVFFGAAFLFAGIGGAWMLYETQRVRQRYPPNSFAPGVIQLIRHYHGMVMLHSREHPWCCCCKQEKEPDTAATEDIMQSAEDQYPSTLDVDHVDTTEPQELRRSNGFGNSLVKAVAKFINIQP